MHVCECMYIYIMWFCIVVHLVVWKPHLVCQKILHHHKNLPVVTDVLDSRQSVLPCTGCGSSCTIYKAASGSFSDGSGSSDYANSASCQWMIAVENAKNVELNFTAFSTELSTDVVRVYKCTNVSNTSCEGVELIAELSGTYSTPQTVLCSTSYVLVQFMSDLAVTSQGFTATWTSDQTLQAPLQSFPRVSLCPVHLKQIKHACADTASAVLPPVYIT
jgi:hypothetical protein